LLGFAVLASLGLADGGLFPRSWRSATLALLALGAAALLRRSKITIGRLERVTFAALASYAAWIALSALWSGRASASLLEAERALLYAVALGAVLLIVERDSLAPFLAGALYGVTFATGYGLVVHALAGPRLDPVEGALLYQPLGYANAVGIFATVGVLLGVGLALAASSRSLRALSLAPLPILLPALYLTSSRGAGLALVAGLAFLVALGARVSGRVLAALAVLAVVALVAVAANGSQTNRPNYWRVALTEYQQNPVLGSGAGTYVDYWLRLRPEASFTRTAHSLYLQSLAELGPVGLALLATAVAGPLLALRRRRGSLQAAAAAAYLAFALHAAIDWDWELPAVTLAGLFCGAAVLVGGRPDEAGALSPRARWLLLAAEVPIALLAGVRLATGGSLPFGS
jgi:O-antigen ligase